MGFKHPARFGPLDIVESKLRGFRQQLADGQGFSHHHGQLKAMSAACNKSEEEP